MIRGLRADSSGMAQGNKFEIRRMHDPVKRQEGAARGEGGAGVQDRERPCDAPKADTPRAFVEVAQNDRRPHRVALQRSADRVELAAAGGAQKAEVDRNDPQRSGRLEIDDHRTARFMSRQVEMFQPADPDPGPRQKRIAVPAKADGIATDGQGLQPGDGRDPVARQGRRPLAQAKVGLLQRHDVCPQRRDPRQHPVCIPAQVGPKALADVPGGEAQCGR